jgi:hypothetical protein
VERADEVLVAEVLMDCESPFDAASSVEPVQNEPTTAQMHLECWNWIAAFVEPCGSLGMLSRKLDSLRS